jgi:putative ABC transport system permease protein
MIYLSSNIPQVAPALTHAQIARDRNAVRGLAAGLHGEVVPLYAAISPVAPTQPEGKLVGTQTAMLAQQTASRRGTIGADGITQLYVATPALLRFEKIDPAAIRPDTRVISSLPQLGNAKILVISGVRCRDGHCAGEKQANQGSFYPILHVVSAVIQPTDLPHYTAAPNSLLTAHALAVLHLKSVPTGWIFQLPAAPTAAQVARADHWATANGLTVETATESPQASLASVSSWAIAVGVMVVLAVLAMTIGLIRSETAADLRVLAATGANSRTRRMLTGATAAALALLGGLLGTATAYLAIVAWYRGGVHSLADVPLAKLAILLLGVPLVALAAGWLLAGREPDAIDRQPLD